MELQTLKGTTRQAGGKGAAKKMRHAGAVPAVLYGGDQGPVSLCIDVRAFDLLIHHSRGGEHAILKLDIEDKPELSTPALVKAVQHDPIKGFVMHADLLRIRLDEKIQTVVPVRLTGQAPGISEGGVLDHQLREIEVECLALEVPDEFVVDVSVLHVNDSIHVSQLAVPAGVDVVTDADRPVVAVLPPRVEKVAAEGAEAEGEGAEAAAPEVISERKEKDKDKEKDK